MEQATFQIGNILPIVGTHHYEARICDLYCGLGVMVHILRDAWYENVIGIDDSPAVTAYWEDAKGLLFDNPLDTVNSDNTFDLVSCFDGSRTTDHQGLLKEMARISRSTILFRPDSENNPSLHDETLRLILSEGLRLTKHNPVHGWYQIEVT